LETEKKMSYAEPVRILPNSVNTMFGIIIARKSTIIREMREARREADREMAANLRSGPLRDEMIALAKRAGAASRPAAAQKVAPGDAPNND